MKKASSRPHIVYINYQDPGELLAVTVNKNPAVIEALLASGAKVNYCIGLALP